MFVFWLSLLCGSLLFFGSWHVQSGWKWKHRYRCLGVTALLSVSHFSLCFFAIPANYTGMFSWAKAQGYTHRGTCNAAALTQHLFSDNRSSIRKRQSPSQHNCVKCCWNLQVTPLSKLFVLFKLSRFAGEKKQKNTLPWHCSEVHWATTTLRYLYSVCASDPGVKSLSPSVMREGETQRAERMWQNMKCVWSVWKQMSKTCSFLLLFFCVFFFFRYRRFLKEKVARSCRLLPRMRILWS